MQDYADPDVSGIRVVFARSRADSRGIRTLFAPDSQGILTVFARGFLNSRRLRRIRTLFATQIARIPSARVVVTAVTVM